MRALRHPSSGLLGRILAIILLTIVIEFCAGTVLYDRASRLRVREDEAHRVAEHLATAARIMGQRNPVDRRSTAIRLSSPNFTVSWHAERPPQPPMSADLYELRTQFIMREPVLADHDLRVYLHEPGRGGEVKGSLRLSDGSYLTFRAPQLVTEGKFRLAWVLMMFVIALGLSLIAGLMVRWTLRPIRQLADAAGRIGHGEQQEPIPEMGSGEVRRLIGAFNEMQARIHSLIEDRTEALAAVGHDLRTPLARLRLRAEEVDDAAAREAIGRDVREMEAMVSSLLAYLGGDSDPEVPERTDIATIAASLVDDANDMGIAASYDGPDHYVVTLRRVDFKRALRNLIENAAKYGERADVALRERNDAVVISVQDDGPGIAPDRLDDVLKPFVRLDASRGRDTQGLGLGLAITVRIIQAEGGTLTLSNRPEGGLRADITLPRQK